MKSVQSYAWFPPAEVLSAEQRSRILHQLSTSSVAVLKLSPEQAITIATGFRDAERLLTTSLPAHSSLSSNLACHFKEIETKGRLQVNWTSKPSLPVLKAEEVVKAMELMEQVALNVLSYIFEEIGTADIMEVVCQNHLVQAKSKSVFNAYLYKSHEQVSSRS